MSGFEDPKAFNRDLIAEYRASAGKVTGIFAGVPMLLLTTVGARSGTPHTTPLGYTMDQGGFVVVASMGGGPRNPAWYYNLRAEPAATVELRDEVFEVVARETAGEERRRLYAQQAAAMPVFNEYERMTDRAIPVVVLEPTDLAVHRRRHSSADVKYTVTLCQ